MQRLLYIIFISFFFIVSCAKKKPSGILSDSEITEILTQASLIDAYLNTLPLDSGRKVMPVLYDNLFKEFKIDSMQFKQNLDFYYGNPVLTEKIYTNVATELMQYERNIRQEDSVRNAFVTDSIRRVTRIQMLDSERRNLTTNYYRDNSTYNYKTNGLDFLRRAELNLNAYGIQTEAIPSQQNTPVFTDPILSNTTLKEYLNVPIKQLLLNAPKNSTPFDFKLHGAYFLHNKGFNVRSGFTFEPTPAVVSVSDTTNVISREIAPAEIILPESEKKIPLEPVKEKIIRKDTTAQVPKKLQIIQQRN